MLTRTRSLRACILAATGVGLAVLTACSSPPSRFYTLGTANRLGAASGPAHPGLLFDVLPVSVPASVARSQFVVQANQTQVKVLEDERWASSLDDEIRNALSISVAQQSGAVDVHGVGHTEGIPVYRIAVDVRRFESWPGAQTLLDAVWSIRTVNSEEVLTCRSLISERVPGGYDAIVDGHRRELGILAAQIVEGIRALATKSAAPPIPTTAISCGFLAGSGT